jgi:hypothetical protein
VHAAPHGRLTAFDDEWDEIEGVLTDAAGIDHTPYRASFANDLANGKSLYRDSQAPGSGSDDDFTGYLRAALIGIVWKGDEGHFRPGTTAIGW